MSQPAAFAPARIADRLAAARRDHLRSGAALAVAQTRVWSQMGNARRFNLEDL